jgi:hypothetical protein
VLPRPSGDLHPVARRQLLLDAAEARPGTVCKVFVDDVLRQEKAVAAAAR